MKLSKDRELVQNEKPTRIWQPRNLSAWVYSLIDDLECTVEAGCVKVCVCGGVQVK